MILLLAASACPRGCNLKVVVTGSRGFIGKNLCLWLTEHGHEILEVNRETSEEDICTYLAEAEFVFHLAGVNRPVSEDEYETENIGLTEFVLDTLTMAKRATPVLFASSIQVHSANKYGASKRAGEDLVQRYSRDTGAVSYIYRLPNVFGKWCRPNYNSFVATFCHNILNGNDITINDPSAPVTLVYIDEVCRCFLAVLAGDSPSGFKEVSNKFETTVGDVARIIESFKVSRDTLISERVGQGLIRALYATYLSYMGPTDFNYQVPFYADERGIFCELLKTRDSGQISFFTAHPGITRGGHYHHSKSEKFLVVKGEATFRFVNIATGERHSLIVDESRPEVVDTIPGWSHDITNTGEQDLVVMLWANEIFDKERPDTIAAELL